MSVYYVNEAAFALPPGEFVDRTLHRLESPLPGREDPLAIEIRRVPMTPGSSLRQLVQAELSTSKASVSGFGVVDEREAEMGGAPAILVRARLRARDSVYLQLQAHVALGPTWIAILVTGPSEERAACEATFERIVSRTSFRRDG